ncbi:Probable 2-oxoglutarate-dependent dioxygenase At3g50210 [Durusdinium trenchii]|uniref:Probable 2-oxoglutarate-dependent dioxygenase At3g50210 n=1 Tax=Durusdinium trenchii TaxID=1381693 RepID=A0ABP0H5Z6_9DINO
MSSSSSALQRQEAARSLDDACSSVGFFYLEGHGVPTQEIQQLHRLAKRFFALPESVKDGLESTESRHFIEESIAMSSQPAQGRGYQRLGENVTLNQRDWQEAIDFFAPIHSKEVNLNAFAAEPARMRDEEIEKLQQFMDAPNVWPNQPAEFRASAEAYFSKDFFDHLTNQSFWCVRVIGYPALRQGAVGLSCGEHTDYGCWTILAQDETPDALEVQLSGGSWAKVPPRAGAFVVNLGDMLSVWTKGRYKATRHRVRQTKGDFRTSIAFFYEPNFDAVIRPLDVAPPLGKPHPCEGSTAPLARGLAGGELIYGEHLFAKVSSNFDFGA